MFSANENLILRQNKRRIVEYVEECIPDDVLDMGTMVMVMQVLCKAPGCVPIETAIIVVYPKMGYELMEGLKESCGGSYKTKVLKPMAEVTKEDVLEALPPQFIGGKRTMTKLCMQARDVMLAQITQLFGDGGGASGGDISSDGDSSGNSTMMVNKTSPTSSNDNDTLLEERRLMVQYLQQCLQDYLDRNCVPPAWGEPFPELTSKQQQQRQQQQEKAQTGTKNTASATTTADVENNNKKSNNATLTKQETNIRGLNMANIKASGNFVFRRPVDDNDEDQEGEEIRKKTSYKLTNTFSITTTTGLATTPNTVKTNSNNNKTQSIISQLEERQHAAGVRIPGCPCCDGDNASNFVDNIIGT